MPLNLFLSVGYQINVSYVKWAIYTHGIVIIRAREIRSPVAIGDQYILTGDYDFNFLDSVYFLNP